MTVMSMNIESFTIWLNKNIIFSLALGAIITFSLNKIMEVISASKRDFDVKKEFDCTTLENLLAAKSWRMADQETADLMLHSLPKYNSDKPTEYQWGDVEVEDIKNMSQLLLDTIDNLWIKYSEGHFGYSIQKTIWHEVDGNIEYEAEIKLGERIGWHKEGKWIDYNALDFTLNAPQGELPRFRCSRMGDHVMMGCGAQVVRLRWLHLLSRINDVKYQKTVEDVIMATS